MKKLVCLSLVLSMLFSIGIFSTVNVSAESVSNPFTYVVRNFEDAELGTANKPYYLTMGSNGSWEITEDGMFGSKALKITSTGSLPQLSIGNLKQGLYKVSIWVKPVDFVPTDQNASYNGFSFVFGNLTSSVRNVPYVKNEWNYIETYHYVESDYTTSTVGLRLGNRGGALTGTVTYLYDNFVIENVSEYTDSIYSFDFNAPQSQYYIADTHMSSVINGLYNSSDLKTENGYLVYETTNTGNLDKEIRFANVPMRPNGKYKVTFKAKALNDDAVGLLPHLQQYKPSTGFDNFASPKMTSDIPLSSEWQTYEFDMVNHFTTNYPNGARQSEGSFVDPRYLAIGIKTANKCKFAIDDFVVSEYPVYFNGDFERDYLDDMTTAGGEYKIEEENGNSYLKVQPTEGTQFLKNIYLQPGSTYNLSFKIRLDGYPYYNAGDGFVEDKAKTIHAGILAQYDSENYDSQYQGLSREVYKEGDNIGEWKDVSFNFVTSSPKEGGKAITPLTYFRVSDSVGNNTKCYVPFSIDDIKITPIFNSAIKNCTLTGADGVYAGKTVTFAWEDTGLEPLPAFYKIFVEYNGNWALVKSGLTSKKTVEYDVPSEFAGRKLKLEVVGSGEEDKTYIGVNYKKAEYIMTEPLEISEVKAEISNKDTWIPGEKVSFSLDIKNVNPIPESVIIAFYGDENNEDVFRKAEIIDISDVSFPYTFERETESTYKTVKIFVWDNLENLMPLCDCDSVTK